LIFTERVKLVSRDFSPKSQPFRARANPLAGADFPGGIVIILRQMLVEILLGIGQIFMGDSGEHGMFQCIQSAIGLVLVLFCFLFFIVH
jgi:hypothetical protein